MKRLLYLCFCFILTYIVGLAQIQIIKVEDGLTDEPISDAEFRISTPGVKELLLRSSQADGTITFPIGLGTNKEALIHLQVAKVGYAPVNYSYAESMLKGDTIRLKLQPLPQVLPNYTVLSDRGKYTEEDNPAVDLVRRAIYVEQYYRRERAKDFTFRKIDRLTIALANFRLESKWLNSLFPSFHRYVLTSKLDGRWVLPLSYREQVSRIGFNNNKRRFNEEILYQGTLGIDERIDDGTMTVGIEELFPHIDLYDKTVKLLNNQFASPLSESGFRYYRYYMRDTIVQSGYVAQVVDFVPKEPVAMTFQGNLVFTTGKEPRLLTSTVQVPSVTNLNFIDDLVIKQHYKRIAGSEAIWHVDQERLSAEFKLYWNLVSFYVEQNRSYDTFNTHSPDSTLIHQPNRVQLKQLTEEKRTSYANELRRHKLLATEPGAQAFLEEIRQNSFYRIILDLGEMVTTDYIRTLNRPQLPHGGSFFDVGPLSHIIGKNSTEGIRLRLGGRTTAYLFPHLFLEGYLAYGFTDKVWKYSIEGVWSLLSKRYYRHEYPRHELAIRNQYELYTPGQIYTNNDKDNILFNIGTSYLTDRTYRNLWSTTYQIDASSDFSFQLFAQYFQDYPTGTLEYVQVQRDNTMVQVPYMTDVSLGVELRWSPGDRIAEGSIQRHSYYGTVRKEVPVFKLKHEMALIELGSDFTHNTTQFSVEQRLWLGVYGRLDYQLTVGKHWNHVPFPMLYTPPVNRALALNEHTFQLLRPLEYVADEWFSLFMQYHLRGALVNHIPLLNRLGIRGVLSINFLYGNTTKLNQQSTSNEIFVLPNISTEMHQMPYLELGFGLENIFRIVRIDLFKRMTPLGPHSASPWGVKGTLYLDF